MSAGERASAGAIRPGSASRISEAWVPDAPEARFDELFRHHYPRVLAYALRRSDSRAVAEEVASESFLIAWRRWDDLPGDPLPWLLSTARKVLANERRGEGRRVAAGWHQDETGADQINPAIGVEEEVVERHLLQDSFGRLSDRDREVLALVFWEGLSNREAAAAMDSSYAAFTLRLHRARHRFARLIEDS